MRKYSGRKIFSDFFKFLSENTDHKYTKIDENVMDGFVKDLYPINLPEQYIEFMRYAGDGQFWVGSSYSFSKVSELKGYAQELLEENEFPHRLHEEDFVFWMHCGYMFYFFKLNEGDDPPVYYYSECDSMNDFVKCSESFTDFIIDPYITGVPNP